MNDERFDHDEAAFGVVHEVCTGVHTLLVPFLFMGAHPINNRSVIVHVPRPDGGALAIINPVELLPSAREGLLRLEQTTGAAVEYLISPGDWHYMFIGDYLRAFPKARAYVPPGRIPSKNPGYEYTLLDVEADNPLPELAPALVLQSIHGLGDFTDPAGKLPRHELAFHIPAARAITSGDVLYYNAPGTLLDATRAIGQVEGKVDLHAFKAKMVRDARHVERSLDRVLSWDFDRYIPIHGPLGNMLARGAKADVDAARAWIRGQSPGA